VDPEEIRQMLRQSGLARIADAIASAAENALRLVAEPVPDSQLALGQSRIGGRPDMARGATWPVWQGKPLAFLGQIDLAGVAGFPCCSVLPRRGQLLFFYEAEQQTWGFDPSDRGSFSVMYSDGPHDALVRHEFPRDLPRTAQFRSCAIEFREVITLPPIESIVVDDLGFNSKEMDRYTDVLSELENGEEDGMLHQLLGHPRPVQNEMQLECQLAANGVYVGDPSGYDDPRRITLEPGATEWRLLLQLDSAEQAGMMWGDLGRLYFWIRAPDLSHRRFDQAWMILQCF
jgi:uncharacterized protein YwqG